MVLAGICYLAGSGLTAGAAATGHLGRDRSRAFAAAKAQHGRAVQGHQPGRAGPAVRSKQRSGADESVRG